MQINVLSEQSSESIGFLIVGEMWDHLYGIFRDACISDKACLEQPIPSDSLGSLHPY